jgi:hypothetical protein
MRDLNYQLKQLCHCNRDGSYRTQADRMKILQLVANQLHEMGYRSMGARSLKPKHVDALTQRWLSEELSPGTIKNRMNCLRWWAGKVNRANVVARSNDYYGIPDRQLVSQVSKAQKLPEAALRAVSDPHVKMSLELQQAFGLRREEAIKFIPSYADQGDHIRLKASWTKGGKERKVPILNQSQREVLDRAHQLAGRKSLIPEEKSFIQQLRLYERQTSKAGLSKLHGLRHRYAIERYQALTGWAAPAAGGPTFKQLSAEQKRRDHQARLILSANLGHLRKEIVSVYLGL